MTKMKYAFFFILLYGINHKTFSQWNNLSINSTQFLYGAYFLNNDTGFVFGDGVVFKTNDGGMNWSSPAIAISSQFTSMNFINDSIGFLVGDAVTVLKTTDGGNNWFIQNSPIQLLYSIDFGNSLNGIAVGDEATIIKTIDGGQYWVQIQAPYLFGDSLFHYELRTVQFINDSVAYAGGGAFVWFYWHFN